MGRPRVFVNEAEARARRDRAAAGPLALVERHRRQAHWRSKPLFGQLRQPEVLFDPELTYRGLLAGVRLQGDRTTALIHFRKQTGRSLWDYVRERRLETAVPLLAETDIPVGYVAGLVGFTEPAQRAACRRRHGLLPSDIRRDRGLPRQGRCLPQPLRQAVAAVARELRRILRGLPAAERQALAAAFRFPRTATRT